MGLGGAGGEGTVLSAYGFFFFMKGEWVLGSAFTQVWYFSTVSLFLRMLCLKLPSNLCTMLFIQDIKYRFTCG